MNFSRRKLPDLRSERGAVLLIIMMITLSIIGTYYTIVLMKRVQERASISAQIRKGLGVKCRKALDEIRIAMDADKKLTGSFPYYLDDEFLDRYKTLDRYVYNDELWTRQAGSTVILDTAFGDSYTLTGYCRDGYAYTYDSIKDKMLTSSYVLKYNEEEGVNELQED